MLEEPNTESAPETARPERSSALALRISALRVVALASALVAVLVGVKILADSSSVSAVALPNSVSSMYKLTAGTPAPEFELRTLDGRLVTLADYRGKTLMVNFWATWCPPCRAEMPDMEQVYQEAKDTGFVVLAINIQEANQPIQQFVDKYGLTFPILLDVSGEVSQRYGVQSLPTSFFIDPEGRISSFNSGALNKSAIGKRLEQVKK